MRHVPHVDRSLVDIEAALQSLKGWPGGVVCIGGEPTMHEEFMGVCDLWKQYVPRYRAGLWFGRKAETARIPWVYETFGNYNFNDHYNGSWHQPILVSGSDVGLTAEQTERNIDRCWLNHQWCPVIVPGVGAYFCEVAATLDYLLTGGKLGMPIAGDWWRWPIPERQRELCQWCGVPHGLRGSPDTSEVEAIGESWARLRPHLVHKRRYKLPTIDKAATCQHYAKPDGVHHWRSRSLRIWLRQKRFGFGYWWRKRLLWPVVDAIKGVKPC